jgi:hypothetical protein
MIIGICGLISSGKGTVADILIEDRSFSKISFADSLKDAVSAVFGWPRHLLEGDTNESRVWREQVDPWWSHRLGIADLTPRWVLQQWGTEVCRDGFHNDIWIASVERKLMMESGSFVIPDVRFPNEIAMIRRLGGTVWRVRRGEDPDWLTRYIIKGMIPDGIHASEWAWSRETADVIIYNDGTKEELVAEVISKLIH